MVAQLQREKDVPRIKVSEAVADIQQVRKNIDWDGNIKCKNKNW